MIIKVKAVRKTVPEQVDITGDHIKLDSFLKFCAAVSTGGEAKLRINDGEVRVNGEVCTVRGRKLRNGDIVGIDGRKYAVRTEDGT